VPRLILLRGGQKNEEKGEKKHRTAMVPLDRHQKKSWEAKEKEKRGRGRCNVLTAIRRGEKRKKERGVPRQISAAYLALMGKESFQRGGKEKEGEGRGLRWCCLRKRERGRKRHSHILSQGGKKWAKKKGARKKEGAARGNDGS